MLSSSQEVRVAGGLKMKDSATNITLGIGCVITALTLSTTCFLTVNAVLAYVGGDQSGVSWGEANAEPIVSAALSSRKPAAVALPETVTAVAKPEVSDSGRPVSRVIPPSTAFIPEPRQESAPPAESAFVWIADSTSSVATPELPARRQDPPRVADVEATTEVSAVALTSVELQRCGDDSFAGAICREAVRWNSCHPDGWNKTPECAVQQFEVFMQ
jgi:hypothetical protein